MFKYFQKNKKNILTRVGHSPSTVYSLFALVLPLSLDLAKWVMWLSLVVALFTVYRSPSTVYRPSAVYRLPSAFLLIIFFFIHVIALTYTSNIQAGVSELLFKSSLFIFPLVVWLMPPKREELRGILGCFVLGCVATGLVCFVCSSMNYYVSGKVSWVSYTWLSSQMGFLPAYLSMYMGFSFFIVLNWLIKEWQNTGIGRRLAFFLTLLFAGYMIVMLGARLVGVTFFVLLVGAFLVWMYQRKMLLKGLAAAVVFALGLWKLMDSFFVTRTRMNKIIGKQLKDYDHNFFINVNDPRGQIWESCLVAIEHMRWWGYGIGDEVERVLLSIYDSKNYYQLLLVDTDAHSQYVQTFLSLGYIGLICLVMMLGLPLYMSWKKKNYLYTLFLLLIAIPMLTECMLEYAHGLMYFSFFNSLLCASYFVRRKTHNP